MCAVQAKEAPRELQNPGNSLTATPQTQLASTTAVTDHNAASTSDMATPVPGAVRDQPGHQLMQYSMKPTAVISAVAHAGAEQPSHTAGVMQKPALLSSGSPFLMPGAQAGSQQAASVSFEPAIVTKALQFSFEAGGSKSGEGGLVAQASAALAEQQQLTHQLSHAVGSTSGTEAEASPKGTAASLSDCNSHEVQPVDSLQPGSPAGHMQDDASLDALAAKVSAMLSASQLLSPENSQGDLPSHQDASPAALVHHGFGQGSVMSRAHAARGLSGHSPALTSSAGSRGTSFTSPAGSKGTSITSPAGSKGTFITSPAGNQGASFTSQQPLQVCVHAIAGTQSRADSSLSMASQSPSLMLEQALQPPVQSSSTAQKSSGSSFSSIRAPSLGSKLMQALRAKSASTGQKAEQAETASCRASPSLSRRASSSLGQFLGMTAGAASIHMEAPQDKVVALLNGDVASTTNGQTLPLSHPGSSPEQVTHPDQWVDVALNDNVIPAFRPASTQQPSPMVLQPVAMAAEDVPWHHHSSTTDTWGRVRQFHASAQIAIRRVTGEAVVARSNTLFEQAVSSPKLATVKATLHTAITAVTSGVAETSSRVADSMAETEAAYDREHTAAGGQLSAQYAAGHAVGVSPETVDAVVQAMSRGGSKLKSWFGYV